MFDADEELAQQRQLFESKSQNAKFRCVLNSIDSLQLFLQTNPSLTRHQWGLLDNALDELKSLVL